MRWISTVRIAVRGLTRTPRLSAVFGICLSLAFASAIAVLAVAYSVLFRPLPVHEPDRLVMIRELRAGETGAGMSLSYPRFMELQTRASGVLTLAALILPALRSAVVAAHPSTRVRNSATIAHNVRLLTAEERHVAWIISAFAVLASVIAVVGIYCLIVYATESRRHELLMKRVLGSSRFALLKQVTTPILVWTVSGSIIGIVLWPFLSDRVLQLPHQRALAGLESVLAVCVLLTVIASLAAVAAAYRGTEGDLAESLRQG